MCWCVKDFTCCLYFLRGYTVQVYGIDWSLILWAGLDFASFGDDLGAAKAAALEYFQQKGSSAASTRAVNSAPSIGVLLNGAHQSFPHLCVFFTAGKPGSPCTSRKTYKFSGTSDGLAVSGGVYDSGKTCKGAALPTTGAHKRDASPCLLDQSCIKPRSAEPTFYPLRFSCSGHWQKRSRSAVLRLGSGANAAQVAA